MALEFWHWLAAGILILILEMLGVGGFLLGMGAAALAVGGWMYFFPDSLWYWQWVVFAVLSVVFSLVYWKKFRRFNHRTDQPNLNLRTASLIGRKVPLLTGIQNGTGKIQIADALWTVRCDQDLPAGSVVEVVAADGMMLQVRSLEGQPSPGGE